ncbi:MAG: NUDIX domain-containing protein [Pseudomonadota bacterium]
MDSDQTVPPDSPPSPSKEVEPSRVPIISNAVSVYLIKREHKSPAVGAPKVLLMRRADSLVGEWCQVAGRIEAGETAWQAALRETAEEAGLTPERLYSADICEQFYVPSQNAIWVFPVFVAFVPANQNVVLNEEHDAYEWLNPDQALDLLPYPGQRQSLRHIRDEFLVRTPCKWLEIQIPSGTE